MGTKKFVEQGMSWRLAGRKQYPGHKHDDSAHLVRGALANGLMGVGDQGWSDTGHSKKAKHEVWEKDLGQ